MKKTYEIRLKSLSHFSRHRNVDIGNKKYISVTIHWRDFKLSKEEAEIAGKDPYITIVEKVKKEEKKEPEFKAEPEKEEVETVKSEPVKKKAPVKKKTTTKR